MNIFRRLQAARGQCEKAVYRIFSAGILACIGVFLPESLLGIKAVTWRNMAVMAVILVLFAGVDFLKARGRIMCLLASSISLTVTFMVVGMETAIAFLQAYFRWCAGNKIEQTEWLTGCQLLQTALIAAVCYLIQILLEKFRFLKAGVAGACTLGLLVCMILQTELPHLCVVFVMLYLILVYEEWLQERWKKNRNGTIKGQMVWLSPFFAGYLLLMAVMPAPETPYDWQWAKDIYSQARETFLAVTQNLFRGGQEDFGMALSGFSEDGSLGEGIQEDNSEIMHLQVEGNRLSNVYLVGKVYDTFDGGQWTQEYHDAADERFIDTMETLYAVRRWDDKYLRDYLNATNMHIHYEFFHTKYVFAPTKARMIRGEGLNYYFDGGDMLADRQRGYGTEYDIQYYQLNTGEELFDELLEAVQEPDEELWNVVMEDYAAEVGGRITWNMVEEHRQKIYAGYRKEIELSEEVEKYLAEVTKGAGTDLEKLQAIEKELSSFTYTRSPGKLPDWVTDAGSFLDYFLLESREGYCTYFATAFALLARAEGIPARYVQGFCAPIGEGMETVVYSGMAHSWPEVYMEGVGWIPFEPTPGYGEYRYDPWRVSFRGTIVDEEDEEEEEEEDAEPIVPNAVPDGDGDGGSVQRLWRMLFIGIPAFLAGCVLVLVLDNLFCKRRYGKLSPEGRFQIEVRRNLKILSLLGLERREQETLQELRERGSTRPGAEVLRFIEDYEDVVYGGKSAGKGMIEEAERDRERMLGLLKGERKWMYLLCRLKLWMVRYR